MMGVAWDSCAKGQTKESDSAEFGHGVTVFGTNGSCHVITPGPRSRPGRKTVKPAK